MTTTTEATPTTTTPTTTPPGCGGGQSCGGHPLGQTGRGGGKGGGGGRGGGGGAGSDGGGGGGGGGAPGGGSLGGGAGQTGSPTGGVLTGGGVGPPQQQPQQQHPQRRQHQQTSRSPQIYHPPVPRGPLRCPARPPHPLVHSELGGVLATFTKELRSGLYVLHTEHSPVSTSAQVAASPKIPAPPPIVESILVVASPPVVAFGEVSASCSCRSFTHRTVLWHHRLGHTSIPRLRTMASHRLVSGLPIVFPWLPPLPAPPCTPCVAGRLRATPHSSLRSATAPFQTLHLDVWGPAPTQGPEREHYFLVVDDDFSRYTMVFPLAKKSEVTSTLIRWLLATEGTRGHCVSCLHSDSGSEFR
ncbi:unnamed protein product [Closterium sp. NIES-54]